MPGIRPPSPLTKGIRDFLFENGPSTIDEIYAALLEGGFKFDAKNDSTAKRSLAISLAKNTATFEKLRSGHIGLKTWYQGQRED